MQLEQDTMSVTKVTSLGSQYSASGLPTVPNPTPTTMSLYGDVVEIPPETDFMAVSQILEPIQEQLNDIADEAALPPAPINTPCDQRSLASSGNCLKCGRRFSVIHNGRKKLGDNGCDHFYYANGTYSNPSVKLSLAEDEDYEMASLSEVLSDKGKYQAIYKKRSLSPAPLTHMSEEGSVIIGLGSPTVNPRIEEYLAFPSSGLPDQDPAIGHSSTMVENSSTPAHAPIYATSSFTSIMSEGVTENTNWAEEVEDSVNHACMRLEQLAKDEHVADPSKTPEEYYLARLKRLIGSRKRAFPAKIYKAKKNHG